MKKKIIYIILLITLFFNCNFFSKKANNSTNSFLAFSLKNASTIFRNDTLQKENIKILGGITKLLGMVYDKERDDIIIVGYKEKKNKNKLNIDDLITSIKSICINKQYPCVSIENTEGTERNSLQKVKFEGGINNTSLGKIFFDADTVLKKLSLGLIKREIWGIKSYLSLSIEDIQKKPNFNKSVISRFWFNPYNLSFLGDTDIFIIDKLDVNILIETMRSNFNEDVPGKIFVEKMTKNFDNIKKEFSCISQIESSFDMIALAKGIDTIANNSSALSFWLNEYKPQEVIIDSRFPVLKKDTSFVYHKEKIPFYMEGGISPSVMISRLKDREVKAFREAVLNSRGNKNDYIWQVPLEGWHIKGIDIEHEQKLAKNKYGCFIKKNFDYSFNPETPTPKEHNNFYAKGSSPSAQAINNITYESKGTPTITSSNIGGVMLNNIAKVNTGENHIYNIMRSGNFSLVMENSDAIIDHQTFRKFITALWAVYFSDISPGISIDPIAPNVKKHIVRYIGNIINTDLARVMREADYHMKKMIVGTERPNILNYKNPDDIHNNYENYYINTWSRFWFVPENFQFTLYDNLLHYNTGKMTLRTEFMFQNQNKKADPVNEEYARYFTQNYTLLSEIYPIYDELYEYAKLVSIAKYLKNNNVPLFWYLIANKEYVLTEESVSTVKSLCKKSSYFKGLKIIGGVNLNGKYLLDSISMKAINKGSKYSGYADNSYMESLDNFIEEVATKQNFEIDNTKYTIIPQHTMNTGSDFRDLRYQTDFAIYKEGYYLTENKFDIIYKEILRKETLKLLKSYYDSNYIRSNEDEAIYSEKAYNIANVNLKKNIEPLLDIYDRYYDNTASLKKDLETLLENSFYLEYYSVILKNCYYKTQLELVRYFNSINNKNSDFGNGWNLLLPYKLIIDSTMASGTLPDSICILDVLSEDKIYLNYDNKNENLIRYIPSKNILIQDFIITNNRFLLRDKIGNNYNFDSRGNLIYMKYGDSNFEYYMSYYGTYIESVYNKYYTIKFKYEKINGRPTITSAFLFDNIKNIFIHQIDYEHDSNRNLCKASEVIL